MLKLLVAGLLLIQNKPPDEITDVAFHKIEDAVRKAKTLQLTFVMHSLGPADPKGSCTGSLFLSKDNKLFYSLRTVQRSEKDETYESRDYWVVSNGTKLMSSQVPGIVLDVPKNFDQIVRWMVLFASPGECLYLHEYLDPKKRTEPFGYTCFQVSGVTSKGFDQGSGTNGLFKFTLDLHRTHEQYLHELKVGLQPPKIVGHTNYGTVPTTVDAGYAEEYQTFLLDADIPDEKFKLPEEK